MHVATELNSASRTESRTLTNDDRWALAPRKWTANDTQEMQNRNMRIYHRVQIINLSFCFTVALLSAASLHSSSPLLSFFRVAVPFKNCSSRSAATTTTTVAACNYASKLPPSTPSQTNKRAAPIRAENNYYCYNWLYILARMWYMHIYICAVLRLN